MIFYKAIKYLIFDICMESLFGALYRNLNNYKNKYGIRLTIGLLYNGFTFSKLIIWKGMWFTEVFENCTVMDIEQDISGKWNLGLSYIINGSIAYREFTGLDDRWVYICE